MNKIFVVLHDLLVCRLLVLNSEVGSDLSAAILKHFVLTMAMRMSNLSYNLCYNKIIDWILSLDSVIDRTIALCYRD